MLLGFGSADGRLPHVSAIDNYGIQEQYPLVFPYCSWAFWMKHSLLSVCLHRLIYSL